MTYDLHIRDIKEGSMIRTVKIEDVTCVYCGEPVALREAFDHKCAQNKQQKVTA